MREVIEPTYLRMVRDRLGSGELTPGAVADLPMGMVGLFEETLKSGSMQERQEWMHVLLVFALLKEGMSVADMAALLEVDRQVVSGVVERFPSWFNSPEPGQFVLYHQRLSAFLLSLHSAYELQVISEKLAELRHAEGLSLRGYGRRHGLSHLVKSIHLGGKGLSQLEELLFQVSSSQPGRDVEESMPAVIQGLCEVAGLAVDLGRVDLFQGALRHVVDMHRAPIVKLHSLFDWNVRDGSKLDKWAQRFFFPFVSLGGEWLQERLDGAVENPAFLRSIEDRLHLLGPLTLVAEGDPFADWVLSLWEVVAEELEQESVPVEAVWPLWLFQKLNSVEERFRAIHASLGAMDVEAFSGSPSTCPLLDSEVEYSFLTEDEELSEFMRQASDSVYQTLLSETPSITEFDALVQTLDRGNLMLRDELLVRITDKLMVSDVPGTAFLEWFDWLLGKSPFEVGPHVDDDRPHSVDLALRFIQVAGLEEMGWMDSRMESWRLDQSSLRRLTLVMSEWWFRQGAEMQAVSKSIYLKGQSRFGESPWLKSWFKANSSRMVDLNRVLVPEDWENRLGRTDLVEVLFASFSDARGALEGQWLERALERCDRISAAEYMAEFALIFEGGELQRAQNWIEKAWSQALDLDGDDWAAPLVQLEVFSAGLTIKSRSWVDANWGLMQSSLESFGNDELIGLQVEEFLMDGVPEAVVKDERFSRGRNREILEASQPDILRFFKKQYPDAWEMAEERREYLAAFEERVSQLGSIREWWREFKPWFRSGGPGAADRWVWERILAHPHLFERFTAEDVRCLNVVTRKTWVRFPAERAIDFHPKVKQYLDRFHVDHWQMGTTWGFEGMGRYRSRLDREDMGDVLQGALESPWELAQDWTEEKHWKGAAFAFAECAHMREEMEQLLSWLELRAQLMELETT